MPQDPNEPYTQVRETGAGYQIDWSQDRHETTISPRHKRQVTSQPTDIIRWLIYPYDLFEFMGI